MAINFEAANMAGYNNPKIEVFTATMDLNSNKITVAPKKSEIYNSLKRGCIPFIQLLGESDGSGVDLLLIFSGSRKILNQVALTFTVTAQFGNDDSYFDSIGDGPNDDSPSLV